jgi:hypothetical protein
VSAQVPRLKELGSKLSRLSSGGSGSSSAPSLKRQRSSMSGGGGGKQGPGLKRTASAGQRISTPRNRSHVPNFPTDGGYGGKDSTISLLKQELDALKQRVATMSESKPTRRPKSKPLPASARPLNFEEKKQLSLGINKLPGDKLARVVAIIRENGMPLGGKGAADEIEIDIDALDIPTLRKLQRYVKSSLAPQRRKSAGAPFTSQSSPRFSAGASPFTAAAAQSPTSNAMPQAQSNSMLQHVHEVEQGTQRRLEAVRAQLQDLAQQSSSPAEDIRMGSALFAPDTQGRTTLFDDDLGSDGTSSSSDDDDL